MRNFLPSIAPQFCQEVVGIVGAGDGLPSSPAGMAPNTITFGLAASANNGLGPENGQFLEGNQSVFNAVNIL
jgi:hypothetical protein